MGTRGREIVVQILQDEVAHEEDLQPLVEDIQAMIGAQKG